MSGFRDFFIKGFGGQLIRSNSAIKINTAAAKLMSAVDKRGWRVDEITKLLERRPAGAPITKRMYRAVSDKEAEMFKNGKMPNSPMSWWSDGPNTAKAYGQPGGKVVSADVSLHPGWREAYRRNDMLNHHTGGDKAAVDKKLAQHHNGFGVYSGHGLKEAPDESWYSIKDKYLQKNISNIQVAEL